MPTQMKVARATVRPFGERSFWQEWASISDMSILMLTVLVWLCVCCAKLAVGMRPLRNRYCRHSCTWRESGRRAWLEGAQQGIKGS